MRDSGSEDIRALLDLARSQLGVREDPLGSGNVLYNTEYYGRPVRGSWYAWCCVFQWWLFRRAGLGELFCGGGKTASCTQLYQFYKKGGRTVAPTDIRPGDLVFFVFDGGESGCMNHVGLCERVEPGYVVTIDGNTGDDEANGGLVARKKRSLRYVGGAARPAYGEEERMQIYQYVDEVPQWARETARKAVQNGYVKMDGAGAMSLWEVNLQPLVWMDRAGLLEGPAREV